MIRFFLSLVSGRFEAATIPESLLALWFTFRIRMVPAFLSHHSSTFFQSFSSHPMWTSSPSANCAGILQLELPHFAIATTNATAQVPKFINATTRAVSIVTPAPISIMQLQYHINLYSIRYNAILVDLHCFSQKLSTFNIAGQIQATKQQMKRKESFVLMFRSLGACSDSVIGSLEPSIQPSERHLLLSNAFYTCHHSLPNSSQDTPHHLPRQTMCLRPQYCTLSMSAIHCAANHRHLQTRLKEGGRQVSRDNTGWRFESLNYFGANMFLFCHNFGLLETIVQKTANTMILKNTSWRKEWNLIEAIGKHTRKHLGSLKIHLPLILSGLSLGMFRRRLWPPCEWRSRHQGHSSLSSPRITFETSKKFQLLRLNIEST